MEVPKDGVASTVTPEQMLLNMDDKGQNKPKAQLAPPPEIKTFISPTTGK